MFKANSAFSGFSVDNLAKAKTFYSDILGLEVEEGGPGLLIHLPGNSSIFAYPKDDHQPATYTCLDFIVDDIHQAVDELTALGVTFERFEGMPQDERGIMRGKSRNLGPDIAWFKDPAGNILAVLEA